MNQKIKCTIKGVSPLLMHSFPLVPPEALEKKSPQEQAEIAAYRCPRSGNLIVPGVNIQRALISAASYSKGKGRSTLQKVAAACISVSPEHVDLGKKDFAVDSRPVVIAATKGRVVRHRPRLDSWQLSFEIEFDPNLIKESELRRVVDDAGSRVGLLDFRPEKKGPFGRFMVTEWQSS